jgi:hypothetical protein
MPSGPGIPRLMGHMQVQLMTFPVEGSLKENREKGFSQVVWSKSKDPGGITSIEDYNEIKNEKGFVLN